MLVLIRFLSVLLALLVSTRAFAADVPIVVVFPIQDTRPDEERLEQHTLDDLTHYLATKFVESGVFKVVPDSELREEMKRRTTESYKQCYDQSCQIEIGRSLAAGKILAPKLFTVGDKCVLTGSLFDIRQAATDAAASVKGDCGMSALGVAIEKLAESVVEKGTKVYRGNEEVTVRFVSEPPGASVTLDGNLLCSSTKNPCEKKLRTGTYVVSMSAERYESRSERINIASDREVAWKLVPSFGVVTVKSEPKEAEVSIDGSVVGTAPLEGHELPPGQHTVTVDAPCMAAESQKLPLKNGEQRTLTFRLAPAQAKIAVAAADAKGKRVPASVYVDGRLVGLAPGTYQVEECSKEVVLKSDDYQSWSRKLVLRENQTEQVNATLEPSVDWPILPIIGVAAGVALLSAGVVLGEGAKADAESGRLTGLDTKVDAANGLIWGGIVTTVGTGTWLTFDLAL